MRGDACPYAHNVFEYWLHPTRYRTQLCNDGEKCARKICFFAHTIEELRTPANKPFVPPEALAAATTTAAIEAARKAAAETGDAGSRVRGPNVHFLWSSSCLRMLTLLCGFACMHVLQHWKQRGRERCSVSNVNICCTAAEAIVYIHAACSLMGV